MKKALLSLALVVALASCTAPATEGKAPVADTTVVATPSTTVASTVAATSTVVAVDTTKAAK